MTRVCLTCGTAYSGERTESGGIPYYVYCTGCEKKTIHGTGYKYRTTTWE